MQIKKSLRKMVSAAAMAAGLLIATVGAFVFTNLAFNNNKPADYNPAIAWTLMSAACGIGTSLFCFGLATSRSRVPRKA